MRETARRLFISLFVAASGFVLLWHFYVLQLATQQQFERYVACELAKQSGCADIWLVPRWVTPASLYLVPILVYFAAIWLRWVLRLDTALPLGSRPIRALWIVRRCAFVVVLLLVAFEIWQAFLRTDWLSENWMVLTWHKSFVVGSVLGAIMLFGRLLVNDLERKERRLELSAFVILMVGALLAPVTMYLFRA